MPMLPPLMKEPLLMSHQHNHLIAPQPEKTNQKSDLHCQSHQSWVWKLYHSNWKHLISVLVYKAWELAKVTHCFTFKIQSLISFCLSFQLLLYYHLKLELKTFLTQVWTQSPTQSWTRLSIQVSSQLNWLPLKLKLA